MHHMTLFLDVSAHVLNLQQNEFIKDWSVELQQLSCCDVFVIHAARC